MADRFKIGGFEKKLLIFFLILSVAPTLLIAVFGVRYFSGYVDRLSNVALRESFRNSMEIARQYSSRLDRTAATMSRQMFCDTHVLPSWSVWGDPSRLRVASVAAIMS